MKVKCRHKNYVMVEGSAVNAFCTDCGQFFNLDEHTKAEIARANRKRCHRNQSATSKRLNGKNVGALGGEDVEHSKWSIEAKTLVKFAGRKIMNQTIKNTPEGKISIAVVHEPGKRRNEDLVLMRLEDWEKCVCQFDVCPKEK